MGSGRVATEILLDIGGSPAGSFHEGLELKGGSPVSLAGVGAPFSGTYHVPTVTHTLGGTSQRIGRKVIALRGYDDGNIVHSRRLAAWIQRGMRNSPTLDMVTVVVRVGGVQKRVLRGKARASRDRSGGGLVIVFEPLMLDR